MSASLCIKCERIVSMYEKYCDDCIKKYGVKQDPTFHKRVFFTDWNTERVAEFQKDFRDNMHFNVSSNVRPETIIALTDAMIAAVEQTKPKKKRKRSHAKHNH